ncbi:MAG TPA: hypothetical protein VFT22_27770 [Kofleriaceae bacterium]|nr:hypothetical protein [Kofleriaceae bacterium]
MKIHIAGFPVRVGTKGRQLCAWCGESLFDVDHSLVMVAPNADGSPGEPMQPWPTGELIAVEGNGKWVVPHEDGAQLPVQCCASPPPRLTVVGGTPPKETL